MKSFEKFQYDTSPYEIDEEVEELDEDLVGMVKKGITATGNVLDKANKKLDKIGTAVGQRVGAVKSNISQSLQKGGVVPKPADRLPSTRRYKPGESTGSPNRTKLAQKQTRSTISSKGTVTPAGTKSPMQKLKDAGGIRSQGVRNVASIGNQIRKGLTAKPDQKISYDAKGSGFGGPTMGVGKNIQQAASNVGDAKLYKPTKVDSVTGKVKKGKVDQTVRDRLGLTSLVNTGKEDKTKDGKEVTQAGGTVSRKQSKKERQRTAANKANVTTSIRGDSNPTTQQKKTTPSVSPGQQTIPGLENSGSGKKGQVSNQMAANDAQQDMTDDNITADRKTKAELEKKKKKNNYQAYDQEGNPISRFGKKQPYITYKTTKDGYPAGKDATHWLDAQKQHSSKTPKLFEQFLFEIETRSTKKKKDGRGMHPHNEIKPMSGTNTITINPEDETSKYKRGY